MEAKIMKCHALSGYVPKILEEELSMLPEDEASDTNGLMLDNFSGLVFAPIHPQLLVHCITLFDVVQLINKVLNPTSAPNWFTNVKWGQILVSHTLRSWATVSLFHKSRH